MTEAVTRLRRLQGALQQPLDIAALAAFRILFGGLMFVGTLRFMAQGWIERLYVEPGFHFKYWGFDAVPALPAPWMHAVFVLLVAAGACVALGLFYRVAIVTVFVAFTYVQLVDVTTYLNHYYLVSLLAALLAFVPAHRVWSLDARRVPGLASPTLLPRGSWGAGSATKLVSTWNAFDVLDPHVKYDVPAAAFNLNMYDNLLRYQGNPPQLVPWVAERDEVADGGRRWTFHLRKGVKFHDGRPLTAADVKFTYESILNSEALSPKRGLLTPLRVIELTGKTPAP